MECAANHRSNPAEWGLSRTIFDRPCNLDRIDRTLSNADFKRRWRHRGTEVLRTNRVLLSIDNRSILHVSSFGSPQPRLGPAQGAVLDMHQLALKVASASRARLVGHVRPPRLPFPTPDGPPSGRWRSGFASTRLHAPAQPHTESPRSMRLKRTWKELQMPPLAPPRSPLGFGRG